jgi:hypothetical protein
LMYSHVFYFCFLCFCGLAPPQNLSPSQCPEAFPLCFVLKVLCLIFKSLFHLGLIFS